MKNIKVNGYIVRDMQFKTDSHKHHYAAFTIVNNDDSEAEYFNIRFPYTSESVKTLAQDLRKGDLVSIEGAAHPTSFTSRKDGSIVHYFYITASQIEKQKLSSMTVQTFKA